MLFAILLLALIAFFYSLSIVSYKYRAHKRNITISVSEIRSLLKCGCTNSLFLDEVAKFRENNLSISILDLASHWMAGGNLVNLKEALLYVRENHLEIDEKTVLAVNLSGKEVIDTIKKGPPYFD